MHHINNSSNNNRNFFLNRENNFDQYIKEKLQGRSKKLDGKNASKEVIDQLQSKLKQKKISLNNKKIPIIKGDKLFSNEADSQGVSKGSSDCVTPEWQNLDKQKIIDEVIDHLKVKGISENQSFSSFEKERQQEDLFFSKNISRIISPPEKMTLGNEKPNQRESSKNSLSVEVDKAIQIGKQDQIIPQYLKNDLKPNKQVEDLKQVLNQKNEDVGDDYEGKEDEDNQKMNHTSQNHNFSSNKFGDTQFDLVPQIFSSQQQEQELPLDKKKHQLKQANKLIDQSSSLISTNILLNLKSSSSRKQSQQQYQQQQECKSTRAHQGISQLLLPSYRKKTNNDISNIQNSISDLPFNKFVLVQIPNKPHHIHKKDIIHSISSANSPALLVQGSLHYQSTQFPQIIGNDQQLAPSSSNQYLIEKIKEDGSAQMSVQLSKNKQQKNSCFSSHSPSISIDGKVNDSIEQYRVVSSRFPTINQSQSSASLISYKQKKIIASNMDSTANTTNILKSIELPYLLPQPLSKNKSSSFNHSSQITSGNLLLRKQFMESLKNIGSHDHHHKMPNILSIKSSQQLNTKRNNQSQNDSQSNNINKDTATKDQNEEKNHSNEINLMKPLDMIKNEVIFEQDLVESLRFLSNLINYDSEMQVFIKTFCFIEIEEFIFFFGQFLNSIYIPQSSSMNSSSHQSYSKQESVLQQKPHQKHSLQQQQQYFIQKPNRLTSRLASQKQLPSLHMSGSKNQKNLNPTQNTDILKQNIKLPKSGLDKIEDLLRKSFEQSGVSNIEEKINIFNENKYKLLPDNLLDEVGGRDFLQKIFQKFIIDLIQSKEFLRDKYEEQYAAIFLNISDPEQQSIYIQLISDYLKQDQNQGISPYIVERIQSIGISLSSIDFFVLKKRFYHYLLNQKDLAIQKQQILQLIHKMNALRTTICFDLMFVFKPENLRRHILLTIKNYLPSNNFNSSAPQSRLTDITDAIINYLTLNITANTFLQILQKYLLPQNILQTIESIQLISTQAFEIYSFFGVEEREELKQKFNLLKYKLKVLPFVTDILPAPISILLAELSDWVQTKITEEALPKEILLKNLEDTQLLEIIFEFSHPEIDSFSSNDSFAAFTVYNLTKNQFYFQIRGFIEILQIRKVKKEHIKITEEFLKAAFPHRQTMKEAGTKNMKQEAPIANNQNSGTIK